MMKNMLTTLLAFFAALCPGHSAEPDIRRGEFTASINYSEFPPDNGLITFDKLLFVKRLTYHSSHFYTDFIDGCSRFGGNLSVLDLRSGKVTDLVPDMAGGIFGRFDLHFSAKKSSSIGRRSPGRGSASTIPSTATSSSPPQKQIPSEASLGPVDDL